MLEDVLQVSCLEARAYNMHKSDFGLKLQPHAILLSMSSIPRQPVPLLKPWLCGRKLSSQLMHQVQQANYRLLGA